MRNKGTINTKTMKMETTMKTRVAERQIKDVINIGTRKNYTREQRPGERVKRAGSLTTVYDEDEREERIMTRVNEKEKSEMESL